MKLLVLILLVLGAAALFFASRMNGTSSFENGSFLVQIVLFVLGGACIGGVVLIFAGKLFALL